ncbi:MAG: alpha/beta hydrolase family protein, partial [Deltaproteobacteria bacterium]|nr:alpha/beta hydrolase family protein [Deltaproteobacteria bacterium]
LDPALLENPKRFFAFLDGPPPPAKVENLDRRAVAGGGVYRRTLITEYLPYATSEQTKNDASPYARTQHVLFEHWVHEDDPPRGTVIALHGFAMGRPGIDAIALFARQWYERGLDVVLLTLPEHGARAPSSSRFSGECFAVPHVDRLGEAVRTAIHEIFALKGWLREQGDAPVGLLGLSLGGYLTALAVGLSDDFDFAIPIVPPACIGDLAWRVFRGTSHYKRGGPAAMSAAELRAGFRAHSPLAHPSKIAKERLLIVAGRGDRVVPPEHPTALWEHWDRPAIHWFGGSHLAPFGRARVVDAITLHLRKIEVL